jgi:predicted ester cyclase
MSRDVLETNKQVVRRLFGDVFNGRALDLCDELVSGEYFEHAIAPFGGEEPGLVHGPDHMRNVVAWLVEQYPDVTMDVEALVAEGDIVVARVRSEGTNLGRLNGVVPPTGKRFSGRQSHWYRIEDGKLAEHWAIREDLETMLQLGILRRPGPPGDDG